VIFAKFIIFSFQYADVRHDLKNLMHVQFFLVVAFFLLYFQLVFMVIFFIFIWY